MRPARSGFWLWLWLAGLAAAAVALVRLTPEGPPPVSPRPASPRVPLMATAAIVVLAAGWLGLRGWEAAEEADARARALTQGNPLRAPALAIRYGCAGCHTIAGMPGADGQVGPPLNGLRHRVFIGGVLPNTAENLVAWIQRPRQFSPGSAMPVTGITADEARDVAAWLYAR